MAADAAQVEGIMNPGQAVQQGISFRRLSELLGTDCGPVPVSSKVLLCRDGQELVGFCVDALEAIGPLATEVLRLLPELLLRLPGARPFWGAFTRGKDVVLLIDLHRLKGLKSYKVAATA